MQHILKDLETRMSQAIETLSRELASVRTGRASAALLEGIRVDYYGTPTTIPQMASVTVPDARTLMVQPWDATQLKAIEKALITSDLGLTRVRYFRRRRTSAARRSLASTRVPSFRRSTRTPSSPP